MPMGLFSGKPDGIDLRSRPHLPAPSTSAAAGSGVEPLPEAAELGQVLHAVRDRYATLEELEQVIKEARRSWIFQGRALKRISDQQLFRGAENFDAYLKERWLRCGIKKSQAYDLIKAYRVAENVRGVTHCLSVRAALVLAELPTAEAQAEVLSQAIAARHNLSPTAGYLAGLVADRLGRAAKEKPKNKRAAKPWRFLLAGNNLTITADRSCDEGQLIVLLEQALAQARSNAAKPQNIAPPKTK